MSTHYLVSGNDMFFHTKEEAEDVARYEAKESGKTVYVYEAVKSFSVQEVVEKDLSLDKRLKEAFARATKTPFQVVGFDVAKQESSKAIDNIYAGGLRKTNRSGNPVCSQHCDNDCNCPDDQPAPVIRYAEGIRFEQKVPEAIERACKLKCSCPLGDCNITKYPFKQR